MPICPRRTPLRSVSRLGPGSAHSHPESTAEAVDPLAWVCTFDHKRPSESAASEAVERRHPALPPFRGSRAPQATGRLMRKVTCSMGVSLDGYIAGPDGGFAWSAPDEDVFRFAAQEVRGLGVHPLGRRLYETRSHWEAVDPPSLRDLEREFAALCMSLPTGRQARAPGGTARMRQAQGMTGRAAAGPS